MGQLEDFRLFVHIVDNGGISKTAASLGIAKSAISRRLSQLESRMGVNLIVRSARQWYLSEAGKQLYQRASSILLDMDDIYAELGRQNCVEHGNIRISVPLHFGLNVLSAALLEFSTLYPKVHLTVDFNDRMVNLVEERYDLSVRISQLKDSSLISKKIGEISHVICASPDYLNNAEKIKDLDDLKRHQILQFGPAKKFRWSADNSNGKPVNVSLTSSMNSDNGQFLVNAAKQGLGIIKLPIFFVQAELNQGTLVKALENFIHEPFGIYALYPETRHLPRRVRLLLDFLGQFCKK